jgi:hypothetical protein
MSSEKDIQRALRWNKANPERHRLAVNRCSARLYKESWTFDLHSYKFPEEVVVLDSHRCKFNGISYHVGNAGYLIANKAVGKRADGKRMYESHKLHRDLFKYYNNQDIPEGYQVHHVDNDVTNNLVNNLMLVDKNEHKRLHNKRVRA